MKPAGLLRWYPQAWRERYGGERAHGGQAAIVARDVVLASVALTGALILACALVTLPALVRFLRADGWRKIRRRVGWAAAASVLAGSALAGLVLLVRSRPFAQLDGSWTYLAVLLTAGVAAVVAIVLWVAAVSAAAWHPLPAPRTGNVVISVVVLAMFGAASVWWYTVQLWGTGLEMILAFWVTKGVAATVNARADKRALAAVWRARRDGRADQN